MARVHNMDTFKALLLQNNLNDLISFDLGASGKYIKTIYYKGRKILGNGQQYNMSSKNMELFEVLQANLYVQHDLSASATCELQRDYKGNDAYNTKQVRTYVKKQNG